MLRRVAVPLIFGLALTGPAQAERYVVRSQAEYSRALSSIEAGDTVVLANGEWRDFDMVISGNGTEARPITVTGEQPGKVFLTGGSSLRIGGEHIVVRGLVFRDGYSPRGEVIAFRRSEEDLARNSRVTEVVIDRFSKPDRADTDYWVAMDGRSNRFDHNHLVGKTNQGVTLAVRLDSPLSRDNGHRIDHNYFGPRPVLGSNGGEAIRIGTSHYSMHPSGTVVENNVFDRTDGEVEIISSKSNGNVFRENLFLRSRGALTLRHGDGNLVERNVFLGHGKDYTGGIRVINRNQTVRGNYMEGLRGTGFSSALTVMNGVPNSPVNRYVQVDGALIERNTVADSTSVTLAAGSDEERSAVPINSVMRHNLFVLSEGQPLFRIEDDVSGIATAGNLVVGRGDAPSKITLEQRAVMMERAQNGLLYPADAALADVGAPRDLAPMQLTEVGVPWYPKPGTDELFGSSGKVTRVGPDEGALAAEVEAASNGDVLELSPGEYVLDRTIGLSKALTIRGADPVARERTVIRFTRPSLIELKEGGNVRLNDLTIDGSLVPDSAGNSVIRTSSSPPQSNMRIELARVTVKDLSVNNAFNVLTLNKGALADRVAISDSAFSNISGAIVAADAERDDLGRYNVEYLDVTGSSFAKVVGPLAIVYRGGTDESTFGPSVRIAGNTFADVGRRAGASIVLHGVQTARVQGNAFSNSAPIRIVHTVGTPETMLVDNAFAHTPPPALKELHYDGAPRVKLHGNSFDGETGG